MATVTVQCYDGAAQFATKTAASLDAVMQLAIAAARTEYARNPRRLVVGTSATVWTWKIEPASP